MRTKRKCLAVLAAGMLAASLSACQGPKAAETAKGDADAGGSDLVRQVSETPTELVFYVCINGWTEQQFMETYGNEIKKKFPSYTLKFIPQKDAQTLPAVITSGQTIDILITSIGLTSNFLLAYEMQDDISGLIKKYNYDLSRLEPSTIDIQRQLADGGIYGLPVSTTSGALFYNKSLFDKFGVPYPTDGMTWDEAYDLAKTMTRSENGQQYKGMTMSVQHLMQLNQLSAPHIDPATSKAAYTSDAFRQAFENLARFYKIPGNGLLDHKYNLVSQQEPFYKDQNVAMFAALSTTAKTFKDTVNWDVVQLPVFKEKPGVGPQSYPTYFYISKESKNKDAAFQVLDYVTSDEFQQYFVKAGNFSILKNQTELMKTFAADDPYMKGKNIKALLPAKFADPTEKTEYQAIADKEMLNALVAVDGGKDENTALREAEERANKAIEADKKK
ncbi:Bacterial extracellular solute-binding protein [Paenibacillus konkukensis]|uniref:Bacterial extracellular solute-binding protein n=1 Tax=Paenibacillus konkukensis TaxID=2020716 RepID=A0ABY4RJL3_9BACL|nr:extracellular solute-binding protein [Paenibacillus konkukensis]UQZ82636.1 Bacterial extracellular solute-binding protein [Paenibacillus konkukensis]